MFNFHQKYWTEDRTVKLIRIDQMMYPFQHPFFCIQLLNSVYYVVPSKFSCTESSSNFCISETEESSFVLYVVCLSNDDISLSRF
jgi:hypothetical protein